MSPPRTYPERPIVGIGAVVWRADRVLLARRARPPRKGEWSLPGGAQKVGETVFEAARREVMEETGIAIEILGLADVVDSIHRDDEGRFLYHYTLIDLVAEWRSGEAVAGGDAAEVAWFGLEDLADLGLWSETLRVIRLAREKLAARG